MFILLKIELKDLILKEHQRLDNEAVSEFKAVIDLASNIM
jgi:hypothetical protein